MAEGGNNNNEGQAANNGLQLDANGVPTDPFILRMRNYVSADPSPRYQRISRISSPADQIEQQMQTDGHKTWGYVIHRTTYESDTDWAECLRRIRVEGEETFRWCRGEDILALHTSTVFNDKAFDGVDAATVRNHFTQWCATALPIEQPAANRGLAPRYRYCVQIDAAALRSIVHDSPPPEQNEVFPPGWVRLIEGSWIPRSENPLYANRPPDPQTYEAIEGITDSDVGWAKCKYTKVMSHYYCQLADRNGWPSVYRRPPDFMRW